MVYFTNRQPIRTVRLRGSLLYSSIRPRSDASASLRCERLDRADLPFEVSHEDAMEYSSLEHNVLTSVDDWTL